MVVPTNDPRKSKARKDKAMFVPGGPSFFVACDWGWDPLFKKMSVKSNHIKNLMIYKRTILIQWWNRFGREIE